PLTAVGGLRVTSNASSVTISWSAPFSLDVTGVDPDIWYSVLIYNVTDENNPTAILCTDCINITETHYTFTPDYLSPCHVYNFSVIPLNGAGQGESSGNVTWEVSLPREKVKARDDGDNRDVTFEFVQAKNLLTLSVRNANGVIDTKHIGNKTVLFTIPADGEYTAILGICGKEETHNFTTFDVQRPHAVATDDGSMIKVTGEFINKSRAKGSFLALQSNFSTKITFIVLKRNGINNIFSETISMPPSFYAVYVHDLEENSLPNMHPANPVPDIVQIKDKDYEAMNVEDLKNASIVSNGSTVTINCAPKNSCVVIYGAYGNDTLNIFTKMFPLHLSLNPDNYSFALFKRKDHNDIDERPFMNKFLVVERAKSSSPPAFDGENMSTEVAVGVAVGVIVIILFVIATVAICLAFRHKPTKMPVQESGADTSTSQFLDNRATTHKMARSQYAEMEPLPTNRPKPPNIETKTQGPYVDVLPIAATPMTGNGNRDKKNADKATPKGPPTVESVMSLLWGVAGRWKMIAEGLEFEEDMIDEIDTNNDMNEGCLQVCVEMWVFKLQPSWEKLSHVLRYLGEEELARQAGSEDGVPHHSGQGQPQPIQSCDGGQKTEDPSKGSSEVVPGGQLGVVPTETKKTENEIAKIMSGELEQEARHSSTPQKDFEKGLDSGVVSGSADLSSMEVRSSPLELSSVEVENGRDSDDDLPFVATVPVDTEVNSACVSQSLTIQKSDTQRTAQPADNDNCVMVTGVKEKKTIPGEEDIRGPMPPNKQSRVEKHAALVVLPFKALQEEDVISGNNVNGDPDSDDGEMTSVQGADHSPEFISPQTVSSTVKVIANTCIYSCYTVL
ncbi:hypothetical protein GBAR_LOCUS28410, partial [Geodia barretti]